MKEVRWARWIAGFDMEELIGKILRNGILISVTLLITGLALEKLLKGRIDYKEGIQGANLTQFVLSGFTEAGPPDLWSDFLLRLSVTALLVTPYLRVLASGFYFLRVERSLLHAGLAVFTAGLLTYILFLG